MQNLTNLDANLDAFAQALDLMANPAAPAPVVAHPEGEHDVWCAAGLVPCA